MGGWQMGLPGMDTQQMRQQRRQQMRSDDFVSCAGQVSWHRL